MFSGTNEQRKQAIIQEINNVFERNTPFSEVKVIFSQFYSVVNTGRFYETVMCYCPDMADKYKTWSSLQPTIFKGNCPDRMINVGTDKYLKKLQELGEKFEDKNWLRG